MSTGLQKQVRPARTQARAARGVLAGVPLRLVLVEDSDSDAKLFQALIGNAEFLPTPVLACARSVSEARALIAAENPDCVLLDLGLPDAIGLSGLQELRAVNAHSAILMLTGLDDDDTALRALRAGAQDYLVKDDADGKSLGRAILRAIQRHRLITELASEKHDAEYHATHDALTGLANRKLFDQRLAQLCAQPAALPADGGVLMLDLDGFKAINDTHGHAAGDAVLSEIGQRLQLSIREGDLAARLGGDEFALLLMSGLGADGGAAFIARLRRAVEQPVQAGGRTHRVSTSVGAALFLIDGADPARLLAEADQRMYQDKQGRRALRGPIGESR